MNVDGCVALVTGGGSGLGAETARHLALCGAKVAVMDVNAEGAETVASEIGGMAVHADITDGAAVSEALDQVEARLGRINVLMNVAGVGGARRVIARDGSPTPIDAFKRTINVNLVGTFNVIRLVAARMAKNDPMEDDERGVIVCTASVAAYDGQIGQAAYAASKGGLVSLTLPLARDLAQHGIRICTIAPGLFLTPLVQELPAAALAALSSSIPFPKRLGKPSEFAALAAHIVMNAHLNGEVIRLDGALRLAPR